MSRSDDRLPVTDGETILPAAVWRALLARLHAVAQEVQQRVRQVQSQQVMDNPSGPSTGRRSPDLRRR
jgi:hypothetical protein